MKHKIINTLRWVARIQSIASIAFFLFFFIGETFFMPESAAAEQAQSGFMDMLPLYLFFISIAGLLLSWKWEVAGGLITTLAFVAKVLINTNVLGSLLLIYFINGLLFLIIGLLDKQEENMPAPQA